MKKTFIISVLCGLITIIISVSSSPVKLEIDVKSRCMTTTQFTTIIASEESVEKNRILLMEKCKIDSDVAASNAKKLGSVGAKEFVEIKTETDNNVRFITATDIDGKVFWFPISDIGFLSVIKENDINGKFLYWETE